MPSYASLHRQSPLRAGRKAHYHYGRPAKATGRLARRAEQDPAASRPVRGSIELAAPDHRPTNPATGIAGPVLPSMGSTRRASTVHGLPSRGGPWRVPRQQSAARSRPDMRPPAAGRQEVAAARRRRAIAARGRAARARGGDRGGRRREFPSRYMLE